MTTAKLWIGLFLTACLYWGCSKNNNSSTPSISLKSINATTIPYNNSASLLTFAFNLSEKTYNPNDTLFVIIHHYSNITYNQCDTLIDNLAYNMVSAGQDVPSTTGSTFNGTLNVSFSNGTQYELSNGFPDIEASNTTPCHGGSTPVNDTAYFSFVVGSSPRYSDTVKAGPIVLIPSD